MAEKNIMRPRGAMGFKREPKEFDERVIEVARVSRVVKGGRRIRFRALVCIGDHKGRVGMGVAKASEVTEAVRKATTKAKKNIITVPIINGTIPHEIYSKFGSAKVMLKPATPGTTIVAGGSVRVVAELAGITDILSKIMGSSNKINNVAGTIQALSSFNPEIVARVRELTARNELKTQTKIEKVEVKEPAEEEKEEKPKEPVKKVAKKASVQGEK
jgi:small subunit ribosomal protein S5